MTKTHPAFGELLRRFRDRASLTQEVLAEQAGLSTDAIGLLERGVRQRPQRHTVERLSEVLGLVGADRSAFEAAARGAARQMLAAPMPALPLPVTTFVGRAGEIAAITDHLGTGATRLLTLTGPGGVGKTRLALEAAARLAGRFPDGVAFVSLAALRDADLVPGVIARVLGLAERHDQSPLLGIVGHVRGRRMLLLLDNCEHLPEVAPLIAELILACPQLALLATSRTALHLSAEHQFPVSPLALPSAAPASPEELASLPAVALFLHRARAVAPAFAITAANASAVAAICRRLDGLPLALELAAAWAKVLPADLLLARLERALPLLADGPRDLPERQRTLRDAITWSYDLLDPVAQRLFRRLAVFSGGWTLELAESICAGTDESPGDVLTGLAALVDASLVGPPSGEAVGGIARFTMLETVREFAGEMFDASVEAETLRRRHAEVLLALVEEAQARLVGPEEATWLARLEAEQPNLRAALRWTLDRRDADMAVRFAAVLWRFWAARTHLTEGRRWLTEILDLARAATAPDGAAPSEGITLLRLAMLLHVSGNLVRLQGDYAAAEAMYEECLAIRRVRDDRQGILGALNNLGFVANERGDFARAVRYNEEALPIARSINIPYAIGMVLVSLGEAVRALGEAARAAELFAESRASFDQIGHAWGVAVALAGLGDAARDRGDAERATASYRESFVIAAELGERRIAADVLEGLAQLAIGGGAAVNAARLLGWADALRERAGAPRPPSRQGDHDRALLIIQTTLGAAAFATAWEEGAALSLNDSLDLAAAETVA